MKKIVSIIIPAYNAEKYIERSVGSVVRQTYKNLEVIFVNDGSVDETPKIVDKYKKLVNIKLINQDNKGVSSARNIGLDNAKGDYIFFLDVDDEIEPGYLEQMIKDFDDNPDVDVVVSNLQRYWHNGRIKKGLFQNGGIWKSRKLLGCLIANGREWSCCGKLYKRKLWNEVRFAEDIVYGEDFLAAWDVFHVAKKVYVDTKISYTYYQEDNSAVHDGRLEKHIPFLRRLSKWNEIIDNQERDIFSYMFMETMWNWLRKGFYSNCGKYDSNCINFFRCEMQGVTRDLIRYIKPKEHRHYIMQELNKITNKDERGIEGFLPNEYKTLYIYGAGDKAGMVAKWFNCNNVKFEAFIVTDSTGQSSPDGKHAVKEINNVSLGMDDMVYFALGFKDIEMVMPFFNTLEVKKMFW